MRNKKRKIAGVDASSTADIAFLLLVFFLVTSSLDQDFGIKSSISKPFEVPDSVTLSTHQVLLNDQGQFVVDEKNCTREMLSSSIQAVFDNEKGVKNAVVLKTERNVEYSLFVSTLNEIKKAFKAFHNSKAQQTFNVPYAELSDKQKTQIIDAYPVVLAEEVLEL